MDTPNTVVTAMDHYGQLVRILLTTEPGSDPARPDFGIGLLALVGQDLRTVKSNLKTRAAAQFRDYLPEVTVVDYVVTVPADVEQGNLTVTVVWRLKSIESQTTVTV